MSQDSPQLESRGGRVKLRCPECQDPVDTDAASCPGCQAARPAAGWQRVAELVVHRRGPDDEAPIPKSAEEEEDSPTLHGAPPIPAGASETSEPSSQEAVARTVYLSVSAPTRPVPADDRLWMRLFLTFLSSFVVTAVAVMGAWMILMGSRPPREAPPVQVVEVERQVPVPVPVPVPAPTPPDDEAEDAGESEEEVAAAPAPRRTARPRPRPRPRPAPVVAPAPEPEPEVAEAASSETEEEAATVEEPPPPPPPEAPAAARALDGNYVGRISGRPGSVSLDFGPEGVVTARVQRSTGGDTVTTTAVGDYTLSGQTATIMLMEQGGEEPLVYSGTVGSGDAQGRLSSGGRNRGRFNVRQ